MDIAIVLTRKYPGALWSCVNNDYAQLDWQDKSPKPTKKAIEDLWPTVQAEIAAEKQAKIDARNSAVAKLEALGLTVEEVSTVFGIEGSS